MKLLESATIGKMELKNRVIMEPMCMYSATDHDGIPTHFHRAHYTSRAIGQVGLIIVEATGVVPEGRITDDCLGLWNDKQMAAFKGLVESVHSQGSKIAIQLNHAGRKCTAVDGVEEIFAPSAIAYNEDYRKPTELSKNQIKEVIQAFQDAAKRANEAGFDALEIHAAHGYLLSEFMSPVSNQRTDEYADASIIIKEVIDAIRVVWPSEKPILIRVSATDYEDQGLNTDLTIKILEPIKDSVDIINVSTGGITPTPPHHIFPGYQVDHALKIKEALQIPVVACGLLGSHDLASYLLESDQVDFIGLARPLLKNPHWVVEFAKARRKPEFIPRQYERGFK